MPRNKHGFLKPDALRAGIPEQYAVWKGDVLHRVSLVFDSSRGGFVTEHEIKEGEAEPEVHTWQVGMNLVEARAKFKAIVRSLGGFA